MSDDNPTEQTHSIAAMVETGDDVTIICTCDYECSPPEYSDHVVATLRATVAEVREQTLQEVESALREQMVPTSVGSVEWRAYVARINNLRVTEKEEEK